MSRLAIFPRDAVLRRARLLPLLAMVMIATACGSTVPVGQNRAPGEAGAIAGDGLALGSGDGAAAGPATTPVPGAPVGGAPAGGTGDVAGGSSATGSGGSTTAPGSGGSSPGGSSPAAGGTDGSAAPAGPSNGPPRSGQPNTPRQPGSTGRTGPGVTAREIVIGIAVADDSSPGNEETVGLEGVTQGDTERYYNIIRDNINRTGGIAGRKIRYSVFRYSTVNASANQLDQQACDYWTQDDRAFAIGAWEPSVTFLSCAQQYRLPSLFAYLNDADEQTLARYPLHFAPSQMNLNRQMRALAAALPKQGYFTKGYRLGVITFDSAQFGRAYGSLVQGLARSGKKVFVVERVKTVERNEDVGSLTAEIQSAVLKFKTDDVSHVVIIDASGLLTLLFTRSAENQAYRPRYGLTSSSGLTTLAQSGGVPEGQFNRALGIGWVPIIDVPAREVPKSAAADRCLAMFKRSGEEPADSNNASIMVGQCEEIDFIKAAVERGGSDITADSFVRGAEALGGTFPSYGGLGNNFFGPGSHDGAAYHAHVKYAADCTCFHYSSKRIRGR